MKKIILIITGSIAAPKGIAFFHSIKEKYDVKLILTKSALNFLPNNADHRYYTKLLNEKFYDKNSVSEHIEITRGADLLIVYPATANFIAQVANGFTDTFASAVFNVCDCPKIIFPAMNTNMYLSNACQRNIQLLINDNVIVEPPKTGMLACNQIGIGRAWETIDVEKYISKFLNNNLDAPQILLNFGRTRTHIDDVRYITNNSSGLMGLELINALKFSGIQNIKAIMGDNDFMLPKNANYVYAPTNQDMLIEMKKYFDQSDVVIFAAALNDFQVQDKIKGKINKRLTKNLILPLINNIDVAKELAKEKNHQIFVGFSLQQDFDLTLAQQKMQEKKFDILVINLINSMSSKNSEAIILTATTQEKFDKIEKKQLAKIIIEKIKLLLK